MSKRLAGYRWSPFKIREAVCPVHGFDNRAKNPGAIGRKQA
jgi:hypothetical protein